MSNWFDSILNSAQVSSQGSSSGGSSSSGNLIKAGGDVLSGITSGWFASSTAKKVAGIEAGAQKDIAKIQSESAAKTEAMRLQLEAANKAETARTVKIAVIGTLIVGAVITTVVLLKK